MSSLGQGTGVKHLGQVRLGIVSTVGRLKRGGAGESGHGHVAVANCSILDVKCPGLIYTTVQSTS